MDLSALARRVGLWIAKNDEDGLSSFVNEEALVQAFSEHEGQPLQDAIAELGAENLVS